MKLQLITGVYNNIVDENFMDKKLKKIDQYKFQKLNFALEVHRAMNYFFKRGE